MATTRINVDLVTTEITGPLFDGRARAAIQAWLADTKNELADRGLTEVRAQLGPKLRNPTGAYMGQLTTDRARTDRTVSGGEPLYGPWLEGTTRRNASTRFKGYRHVRRTRAKLRRELVPVAQAKLMRYLSQMGSSE